MTSKIAFWVSSEELPKDIETIAPKVINGEVPNVDRGHKGRDGRHTLGSTPEDFGGDLERVYVNIHQASAVPRAPWQ